MLEVSPRKSCSITQVEKRDRAVLLHSARGTTRLEPITDSIVRVCYIEHGEFSEDRGIGIQFEGAHPQWRCEETPEEVVLYLSQCVVRVSKASASLSYWDANQSLLLSERDHESKQLERFMTYKTVIDADTRVEEVVTPDGIKRSIKEAKKIPDRELYHTRLFLQFKPDEKLYGLGQAEEGVLNLRGTTQYLHQANLKIAIPFLLSSKGYGLLFATGSPAIFNDTIYGSYFYTEADEQMDFYFIYGPELDMVVKGYRLLTGKAAMLPRWAFGYMQSQERYETQDELIQTVEEHRRRQIGLDGIVQDWCSWSGDAWGQKTLDPQRYPTPEAMMEHLHQLHARLMISIWPNMSQGTDNHREFAEKNLLLPASEIYNAFDPRARALYWKQVKEGLFDKGIDAWWCDSSEPFTPEWGRHIKPEPSDMYHAFVEDASRYVPQACMNAYGLFHAQTMYEGQRGSGSTKRVINLTRNTYTGGQRYGVVLWSGDTYASWETLKKQIPSGLNFCATGFPYWTVDIGAFFVKKGVQWFWNGEYDLGLDDLGYRELFVRWYQYGAFLPIFRSHGTDVRREIWHFGEEGSMFYEALKKANQLRYRLIPYIYSWAGKVWKDDSTLMRMLAFDFPEDAAALEVTDAFMFGSSLLVCPITEPMYYGHNSVALEVQEKGRWVYLPQGCDWYDFYTGARYTGGQTIFAQADIDHIPLFVRSGSILPLTQPLQNTDEVVDAPIEYHVYAGSDAEFELYEDDGDGYGYENGQYTVTRLVWKEQEQKLFDAANPDAPIPVIIHR